MLNRNYIANVPVSLPPLIEQRRIAAVLGVLDDLINANERLRASCEALGRDYLESEMAHRRAGDEVSKGWEQVTVASVLNVFETGSRPKGGVAGISKGSPSIGAESIGGIGVFDFAKTRFVPSSFATTMRRGLIEDRDVLVYKDGGKPGDFKPHIGMFGEGFPFAQAAINEHVYRIRSDERVTQEYLYFWLSSVPMIDAMARAGTGAAIPGLNRTAFGALPIMIPPTHVATRLFPILSELTTGCLTLAAESAALRRTRAELLPLLMSGKVRVRPSGEIAA